MAPAPSASRRNSMEGPTPPRARRESSTRSGTPGKPGGQVEDEGHALVAERCQEFLAVQVNLSNLVRVTQGTGQRAGVGARTREAGREASCC